MAQDLPPDPTPDDLLRRLAQRASSTARYKLEGEVARGGMGSIIKIWDEDLRRHLAMKVVLGKGDHPSDGTTPSVDGKLLARFLEEAQVTSQLDHPGIVPVHELGLDSDGRVYFTMKLVKGRDLKQIFDLVFEGKEDWNETRALGVILKVCEAMAYAHAKGVIHRDLKPANVMIGSFGEVYVMDWGLSRVLGSNDKHDIRIKPEFTSSTKSVKTERREAREHTPDSPIVTMDGDVMGTPAFMSPEQARGEIEKLGPRSDVYAIGAMLYHLLAHQMPYVPPGGKITNRTVLARVLDGPPKSIASLRRDVPAELVAICERAMARDAGARYPDTLALADDLRAYLEHRVVGAYETGTWAETRKWVKRNKALAASISAGIVVLLFGIAASVSLTKRAEGKAQDAIQARNDLDAKNQELNKANTRLLAGEYDAKLRGVISELAYFETLDDDVYAEARKLDRPASEWWIKAAQDLLDGSPEGTQSRQPGLENVKADLARLRERALDRTPAEVEADHVGFAHGKAAAGGATGERRTWHFDKSEDEWWHGELVNLVAGLERVQRQVECAKASVDTPDAKRAWQEAIDAISASEKYRDTKWPNGTRLTPQLGLVPIGPDTDSGLWEFAHLATGTPARRGSDRKLVLEQDVGLVFVLLPGGHVPVDVSGDGIQDASLTRINLDPFFLSKYEMTCTQWNNSDGFEYFPDVGRGNSLFPATRLSWDDCQLALSRNASWLRLPSEAQWEYGCRGGSTSRWWPGNDERNLRGVANLELNYVETRARWDKIGLLRANAFGLHDVHGNVIEWCADAIEYQHIGLHPQPREGDGLRDGLDVRLRAQRGGVFWGAPAVARSSFQSYISPDTRGPAVWSGPVGRDLGAPITGSHYDDRGVRPARGITP